MSLAEDILALAQARGVTITTAESCTGGMVAAAITDIAGSSNIFGHGFISYANKAKQNMLGVSAKTLDEFGAVSEEVCREMATGALTRAGADVAVAISGIAGPGSSDTKPEGRVCFALATAEECQTQTMEFGALGRGQVRLAARDHALELIKVALNQM